MIHNHFLSRQWRWRFNDGACW